MTAKIIKVKNCKTSKELLLAMHSDSEKGIDYIELSAWHEQDGLDYYQYEEIRSDDSSLLKMIISNFSEVDATKFLNAMLF